MAIIYTYGYDDNVQDGDAWIGTNASNRKTKQFTVASVANYLNRAGRISIGGQMTFKFVTLTPATGTISLPTLGGDGTNFTDIASLYVSAIDTSGANITEWLDYLVGQELLISEQQEPNNFGHYRITSYTVDTNPSFYTLVLTDIGGYGTIKADTYYNLNNINLVTGTTDPTGLEAINEGNGIGWRLIGRDADNYGNIGLNAIDFSNSDSISTEKGSVGQSSITFGNNNINQQTGTLMLGTLNNAEITDIYQGGNIITGYDIDVYGAVYNSHIGAYRSTIGVQGTNYTTNAIYQSVISGDGINFYAGRDAGAIGGGLISGSTGVFTVGLANEDLTTTTSSFQTSQYNNYGPRFIVGCGTYNPVSQVATRANGFVVMSDGTAKFPILTNSLINAAGDDSAVTKGWVNSGPALTSEQVRIEVKNTSGATLLCGTPVYITGTVGATIRAEVAAADASNPAKMPSVGVLAQDLINNADGFAVTGGFLSNVTTDPIDGITPVANQTVYVKPGGGLTLTKPTGSNLIQNIAKVGKISGGNAGSLVISSILRTNDIPNLTTGKIWVGTAANTAESGVVYLDEGNGRMGIGTTSPSQKLDIAGDAVLSTGGAIYGDTTNPYIRLNNTGGAVLGYGTSQLINGGSLQFQSTGGVKFRVNSSGGGYIVGNFGFGTTSPTQQLHVDGQILLDVGHRFQLWNDNVGIYRDSNDLMLNGFGNVIIKSSATTMTAQTERMRITSTGNVGIGTTSPVAKLHVFNSGYPQLNLESNTGSWQVGVSTGNDFAIRKGSSGSVYPLWIDNNENVGIGTTSPATKLEVAGVTTVRKSGIATFHADTDLFVTDATAAASTAQIEILGGNAGASTLKFADTDSYTVGSIDYSHVANSMSFRTNNSIQATITSTGNVGIGLTSPATKLDVKGPASGYVARFRGTSRIDIYDSGTLIGLGTGSGQELNLYSNDSLITGVAIKTTGQLDFKQYGSGTFTGTATQRLAVDSSGNVIEIPIGSGPVDGSGTANYVTKWSDADTITNSIIYDNGTNVGIGTASPGAKLDVQGTVLVNNEIRFVDSSMRIFRSSNDMRLRTGNSDRMTIDSLGNVGIGTTSPSYLLHVDGGTIGSNVDSTANNTSRQVNMTSANTTGMNAFTSYSTNTDVTPDFLGKYGYKLEGGTATANKQFQVYVSDAATPKMVVNGSGNVGIGTASPGYKLHVIGDASVSTWLYVNNIYPTSSTNDLLLNTGAGRTITLDPTSTGKTVIPNGNVGIGTTSPSEKLDIEGSGSTNLEINNTLNSISLTLGAQATAARLTAGTGNRLGFGANNTADQVTISTSGNVGIGTTNPTHRLYVQGNNGTLLVAREITTPNQARIGIGENNPSSAITFGSYSDRTITGAAGLRFVNGSRISELNTTRLAFQAGAGYFFYPTGTNPSGDVYGVDIRHLRDSAVNTTDAVLEVNNSANSSLMLVRSDGNVGIGITSPSAKLHVDAGTAEFKVQDAFNGGFNGAQITGTNAALGFIGGNLDEYILTALNDGSFRVYNPGGAGYAVTLTNTGLFGIGTTIPAYKLDVSGDIRGTAYRIGSATILSGSTSVSLGSSGSTGTVSLVTTSGQGLVLNGSNVGIGTTSPAAKLDVNGGVRVADDAATASATNVGTLRYRTSGNNSYVDMCMQTGAATYAWVNIVQNNW